MSESGRRGNLIWNYFDKVDEETKEAECKLCHNLYNYKTTSHNLKLHLKHKHNDEFMNLPGPETVEKKLGKRNEGGASVWGYFELSLSITGGTSCTHKKYNISPPKESGISWRQRDSTVNSKVYNSESRIASCNECRKTFSYKTTIANLKTHLKRAHKELFVEMEGGVCEEVYLDDGDVALKTAPSIQN